MSLKSLFFVTLLLITFQQSFSQRNFNSYNRIGLNGGLTLFDINTSDFVTEQATGIMGGFTTRGDFYNNFALIYGISFYSNQVGIQGSDGSNTQFVDYSIIAAQLNFLGSYNIIKHHLSLEAGPILNINGKMKLKRDGFEDYILEGYDNLRAEDIQDVSKINFHLAAGITGGFESFRVSVLYQYGVTNMFGKLNDKQGLEDFDFEGHSSTIAFMATMYF